MPRRKKGVTILNPKFDQRMKTIGTPSMGKLKRGYIVHAPEDTSADTETPARSWRGRINFLYNPSSISVNHPLAMNLAEGPDVNRDDPSTAGPMVGIGSLTLPLLFDRTYEIWDRSANNIACRLGVYADVLAFYHFLGMTAAETDEPSLADRFNDPKKVTQTWASMYPVKPNTPTLAYVYIGDKLKYYGQLGNLDVTYSHFSWDMIPTRCAVSVGLELQEDPNASSSDKVKVDRYVDLEGSFAGGLFD